MGADFGYDNVHHYQTSTLLKVMLRHGKNGYLHENLELNNLIKLRLIFMRLSAYCGMWKLNAKTVFLTP